MTTPKPDWQTEKNIALARLLYQEGLGAAAIGQRVGVSKGTISGWLNRSNLRRDDPLIDAPHVSQFWAGAAPRWLTPEADALFGTLWDAGVKTAEMQEFFGITDDQRRVRREKLGLAPRDPRSTVRRRNPVKEEQPQKAALPAQEVNRRMASPNGGRQTSFTGQSWCMATLPKPAPRVPGVCNWPLSCDAAAVGRFCAVHAGLIGKRAA